MNDSFATNRTQRKIVRTCVLAALDVLAVYAAFTAGYLIRSSGTKPLTHFISLAGFCRLELLVMPLWIVIFTACGLYSTRQSHGRLNQGGRIFVGVTVIVMVLIVIDYLSFAEPLFPGRAVPLYALVLGVVFVCASRQLIGFAMRLVHARGRGLHHIIMIGTGPLAERLSADVIKFHSGNRVLAAVSAKDDGLTLAGNIPVYATLERALEAHPVRIDEILLVDVTMPRNEVLELMATANARGMGFRYVPDLFGVYAAGSTMSTISGIPVLEARLTALDGWATVSKRAVDVVGAAVGLVLLSPLFLLLALLVKLNDPDGPVFYKQARLGRGGKPIKVYKFRSMDWAYSTGPTRPFKTAVEAFQAMGRPDLCAEFVHNQKVADDPRVSKLGVFLRRTSLDELPQLLNALLGHLSLVGPRPITQEELERYGSYTASFLALKPGITGLWQVSGRSDTGYEERVKLDLHYVEKWSHRMDLTILARTVVTVAARRGAY